MAIALSERADLSVHVRLDERSAAYVALGIGLESGMPAVMLTTSGTAAAELHPALVEAHQARIPLIVCTADRPVELHGVGAPQTIEQAGLYGGAARLACDVGVPDAASAPSWRSLGSRLVAEAVASPLGPGPVHLNVAFREPLDGTAGEVPPGRAGGRPWHEIVRSSEERIPDDLVELICSARRPLIIAGARAGTPALVLLAAEALGAPVLADPRSGCRDLAVAGWSVDVDVDGGDGGGGSGSSGGGGSGVDDSGGGAGYGARRTAEPATAEAKTAEPAVVVSTADALLRVSAFRADATPDLVLRLGEAWASKVVNSWLEETAESGAEHVLVDPHGEWRDPGRDVARVVHARPDSVLRQLVEVTGKRRQADSTWMDLWRRGDFAAGQAIEAHLGSLGLAGELSEPWIARAIAAHPATGVLVVSSSMPVRELEWFSAPRHGYPRVLSNRGANGIDGVVSTTIGIAMSRGADDEPRTSARALANCPRSRRSSELPGPDRPDRPDRPDGPRGPDGPDGPKGPHGPDTPHGAESPKSSSSEMTGNVIGLVGDLAFLHDASALVRPASSEPTGFGSGYPCGIVVVDNDGGGIFSYLSQAATVERERFELLFGTPQAVQVAELARGAGCSVTEVDNWASFAEKLDCFMSQVAGGESAVLVCKTDRSRGVVVHEELAQAVAVALGQPNVLVL
jgi:2-succinyl-5-enolpyruvyl-6-hydroxy-3-cyclohexene-1-carboxylate synthase